MSSSSAAPSSQPKKHHCLNCDASFSTNSHLRRHERTHTGQRNHKCPYCEATSARQDNLNAHIQSVHINPHPRQPRGSGSRRRGRSVDPGSPVDSSSSGSPISAGNSPQMMIPSPLPLVPAPYFPGSTAYSSPAAPTPVTPYGYRQQHGSYVPQGHQAGSSSVYANPNSPYGNPAHPQTASYAPTAPPPMYGNPNTSYGHNNVNSTSGYTSGTPYYPPPP
ncbi:hypothetical protein MIND_00831900 [Mycena indigotica]|uniref:C2H2-type domain-containing protein n=1 Tax=Mycena indigotica TaxID=2126181 RepID=A0A8H6SI95_9AGAR|nr:uncharacterized protein MIND_00831900 [Mycena indigotica]KAF7298842.1 hypothetical protein MIND_00831900 [Mycena indigotica]